MDCKRALLSAALLVAGAANSFPQRSFVPLKRYPVAGSPLALRQSAQPNHPFSVVGEEGAILGWQDGRFELWEFPVKLLENFHITIELADYPVPIDVNRHASSIEVDPGHTTIVYSHAAFTIRQHMFAPRGEASREAGAIVVFEVDSTLPATLHFRFDPLLVPEWPAAQFGRPDTSWMEMGDDGGYLLASSDPTFYGVVAMPHARKVKSSPYSEWPSTSPIEFTVDFDPKRDRDNLYPLIAVAALGGDDLSDQVKEALTARVTEIEKQIPSLYSSTQDYYSHFFDDKVTVKTPDPQFDDAFRWAALSIDQCQVRYRDEVGVVAGWYSSGNSGRPGFGWFFGRDTLWSLYAMDSYGGFALARAGLEFLIRRQREDGKIMHEYSQTADRVEWARLPYWYAAADSTPLFVMSMEDYVRSSGDLPFLREHWGSVQRAYAFTRQHDSDHDGIYDNDEGTGWVESWKPKLPHQELYLAALDQQSAESFARLAAVMGDQSASASALGVANAIRQELSAYRGSDGFYAFSRNADGSYDRSRTIFPAVAWWSGRLDLPSPETTLQSWSSHEFATDWGSRSLSPSDPFYDPLTYHQGTVWPLFTGWAAMAQYRSGRPLAGYSQLMSNLQLTYAYDLGATAELFSGQFFAPMPRASSHQLWSSAMTLAVAMRGLFGLEADVLHRRLHLAPKLPSTWDSAELHNLRLGGLKANISMKRGVRDLTVVVSLDRPGTLCLDIDRPSDLPCTAPSLKEQTVKVPLPAVEVGVVPGVTIPGAETSGIKVLDEHYAPNEVSLRLEAPAGTTHSLPIRLNGLTGDKLQISGASLQAGSLIVKFADGAGYKIHDVRVRW